MAKIINIIILLIFTIISTINCECLNKDPCVCILDDYTKINLTEATFNADNKPRFLSDSTKQNLTFEFYGCTDGDYIYKNSTNTTITLHGSLISVNTTNGTNATVLGHHRQIRFNIDDTEHQLIYTADDKKTVLARIDLICDTYATPFIKVINNDDPPTLALSSPHNCLIIEQPELSTGSVLVIIFFIVVSIYLFCGAAILYFIRGARGLEMIPNIDFWRGLPGLVKDGVIFLFSGCNVTSIDAPDTYDRI